MSIIALDLGGTKLAIALLSEAGKILSKEAIKLDSRSGKEVGLLITSQISNYITSEGSTLRAIGVSVPGISHKKTGTVWAPNIPGWEDYPLVKEIQQVAGDLPVAMDSDRACCILGEQWLGNAKGCDDAIYLAVGTGIGAGILTEGKVLRGAQDIAGAVGWLALQKPFHAKYTSCGCFEYYASGEGIAKLARELLAEFPTYRGGLREYAAEKITAHHVFSAYESNDMLAIRVFKECIEYWGMAIANLISIFNPEKVIFGGGIFGPGVQFISSIKTEAAKWAQPISMTQVRFEESGLHGDASIYGAGYLALKSIQPG